MTTTENEPAAPGNVDVPYSDFTIRRRRYLVGLLGYVTLAPSLTATIYFPLINPLSEQFKVSIQDINLTITLYVVFQAISPALFAPLSDTFGRRPVLLINFAIYVAASFGLSLNQSSYAGLLVLRGMQSFGGSAVLSLAYGIVSDMVTHAERGSMLGPLLAATNLGPCAWPLIGGLVTLETQSFAWCFWTLVIFGAVAFLLIGWTLPETARPIVGNGSIAAKGIWRTWWDILCPSRDIHTQRRESLEAGTDCATRTPSAGSALVVERTGRGKLIAPNPLVPLRIVFYKDTFLTLWTAAVVYTVWYCVQTSILLIYGPIYHFSELEVGLSYLAGGFGVIAGGFVAGRLMDWNYRVVAAQHGLPVDKRRGDDMTRFPIEQARSRGSPLIFAFYLCEVVGLGWSVQHRAHCSVSLVLQFLIGAKGTIIHQSFNTLLVDVFPENPGTAAAAGNITRCGLSAAVVACIEPLVAAMGYGNFFTLVGLLSSLTGLASTWLLRRKGCGWREQRLLSGKGKGGKEKEKENSKLVGGESSSGPKVE
ncbi:MFS general substrate transporter [Xylariomycetidae sp. FL2044]|nr:MFS general substrate transporter [Xylariomycetidae sp. FL2044]